MLGVEGYEPFHVFQSGSLADRDVVSDPREVCRQNPLPCRYTWKIRCSESVFAEAPEEFQRVFLPLGCRSRQLETERARFDASFGDTDGTDNVGSEIRFPQSLMDAKSSFGRSFIFRSVVLTTSQSIPGSSPPSASGVHPSSRRTPARRRRGADPGRSSP